MFESEERGKEVIEGWLREIRPGKEHRWWKKPENEVHMIFLAGKGRLEISRDAVDQAADEPGARPRLRSEVERALRDADAGGVGYVREV